MFGVSLLCTVFACKKTTIKGSPDTHIMSGNHNFHRTEYGYNPYLKEYISDTSDAAMSVTIVNSGAVTFDTWTFSYDSTSADNVLHFRYTPPSPYVGDGGYLTFDKTNNVIFVYKSVHISAAGGQWTYTYTSF